MTVIAHGRSLRMRLFLEGVEVPCISANIDSSPNSPATATLQVPPMVEGTRLLPRTLVHLFFLDFAEASAHYVTDTGANAEKPGEENPSLLDKSLEAAEKEAAGNPAAEKGAFGDFESDKRNAHYKLMFVGEVVGFQWNKRPMNRSLTLQCMDLSNYWDYAYQFNNTEMFGPGMKAVFSGGATNLFTDFLSTKGSILTSIVVSGKCNRFPNLKGLAAGIVRLVEAIGGVYYPKPGSGGKRVSGQNLFFSIAELRLHLTQMITAYEDDPTSSRIISRQGYSGMFDRALGGSGEQTSIRMAMNAITKIIFHEVAPQPCPYYIPGTEGEASGTKRVKVKGHPSWDFISTVASAGVRTLNEVNAAIAIAPGEEETTDDSFFSGVSYDFRNPGSVPARLHQLRKDLIAIVPEIWKKKVPNPARSIFSQAAYAVGVASVRSRHLKAGASVQRKRRVTDFIDTALTQLKRAENLTVLDQASKNISPARLVQQILRPDVWFASPPRCNVIFPDRYSDVTYARNFLQEPTRLLLKTNDEFFGEDVFFDSYYFAPQAGSVKKDHARLTDITRGDVLDHELFTGILPVFEKMGEFNVFAARSTEQSGRIQKVSFAQRSANFLYFKHRFNARQASVSGPFNPYVAAGFPGLVIDRWINEAALANAALDDKTSEACKQWGIEPRLLAGTNFLGNFTNVSHRVTQQPGLSGTTSINLSYPRQPDESIEFLGGVDTIQRVQKREAVDAVRATDVAAVSPPRVFSLGPNGGRIINVEDVTSIYTPSRKTYALVETMRRKGDLTSAQTRRVQTGGGEGKRLPMFGSGEVEGDRPASRSQLSRLEVPVGRPITGDETEKDAHLRTIAAHWMSGETSKTVTFRAFRLTEEVPRYRREDVLMPVEEMIRPGWYGDIWSPSKVGKVWTDFFGIGSITDAQTILSPGGGTSTSTSEEAEEALSEQQDAESADDPRRYAPALMALDEGSSIQEAVEFLLLTYSHIKNSGMDVEEFIRAYTWRPIASMLDMFGTQDLLFSEDGEQVLDGIEGFHSRAFGEYENLYALTTPEIEDIIGIKRGAPTAQRADTRLRKIRAVQAYRSALLFTTAVLG